MRKVEGTEDRGEVQTGENWEKQVFATKEPEKVSMVKLQGALLKEEEVGVQKEGGVAAQIQKG